MGCVTSAYAHHVCWKNANDEDVCLPHSPGTIGGDGSGGKNSSTAEKQAITKPKSEGYIVGGKKAAEINIAPSNLQGTATVQSQ